MVKWKCGYSISRLKKSNDFNNVLEALDRLPFELDRVVRERLRR